MFVDTPQSSDGSVELCQPSSFNSHEIRFEGLTERVWTKDKYERLILRAHDGADAKVRPERLGNMTGSTATRGCDMEQRLWN